MPFDRTWAISHSHGGNDMKSQRIQVLLAGVTACISLMFFITPTHGANIVIGGNTTDIGTIIFVSPKPGDTPAAAGTALLNTINGIADNSAENPYLIKVGPGVYDLGAGSLQMKEYVDIEGSGEKTTKITGVANNFSYPPTNGTINGASNAELRFLTVENTGVGYLKAALLNSSASPSILHVTANASGGSEGNFGVYNSSSSPVMTNVTASGSGGTYCYGVYNASSGTVKINHSVIKGTNNTMYNESGVTTRVANTQLDGGYVANFGTLTCVGAYDGNYVGLNTNCLVSP